MNDTGFTPTISQVRQAWAYFQSESRSYTGSPGAEFNRWLTSLKAEVWGQGYADGQDSVYTSVNEWPNPDIKNPYLPWEK